MRAIAVAQMFDWTFDRVATEIPVLARLGYTHLHVSPGQPSNEAAWPWWGRYQPLSHEGIAGPLGDEAAFARLCTVAADRGVAIVADIVAANPCGPPEMLFGHPAADMAASFAAGIAVLDALARLGARGFRFDGAARIPPAFLHAARARFPQALMFGEIVTDDARALADYVAIAGFRLYDFPWLASARAALAPGGDLRALIAAGVEASASLRFVRNHDIERGQAGDRGIDEPAFRSRFGVGWDDARATLDRRAVRIAHAAIFGRGVGVPYVLSAMPGLPDAARRDRHDDPEIAASLAFARRTAGTEALDLVATPDLLLWQRGTEAFAVIGAAPATVRTTLRPGRYDDLLGGTRASVRPDGVLALESVTRSDGCVRSDPAPAASGAGLFVRCP